MSWAGWRSSTSAASAISFVDLHDYRHQDSAQALAPTSAALAAGETEALLADLVSADGSDSRGTLALTGRSRGAPSLVQRLYELSYHELAQVIVMWMGRLTSPVTRRALMSKLSAAFTVAAAAPLFDVLDPDEQT